MDNGSDDGEHDSDDVDVYNVDDTDDDGDYDGCHDGGCW